MFSIDFLLNFIIFPVVVFAATIAHADLGLRTDTFDKRGSRAVVVSGRLEGVSYLRLTDKNTKYSVQVEPLTKLIVNQSFQTPDAAFEQSADGDVVYRKQSHKYEVEFRFTPNFEKRRLVLTSIRRTVIPWMFNGGADEMNLDDSGGIPPAPQASPEGRACAKGSLSTQAATCASDIVMGAVLNTPADPRFIDCKEQTSAISAAFTALADDQGGRLHASCVSKYEPDVGQKLSGNLASANKSDVTKCSTDEKSGVFDSQIYVGLDFARAPSDLERQRILFHESIHKAAGEDESLTRDLANCCIGAPDSKNACDRLQLYENLKARFVAPTKAGQTIKPYKGLEGFFHLIAESNLSLDEKNAILDAAKNAYLSASAKLKSKGASENLAAVTAFNTKIADICTSKLKASACATMSARLSDNELDQIHIENMQMTERTIAVATSQMRDSIGKTAAAPVAETGPPVPQNLEVRPPDANRLARVRDQMEQYSRPYRAVTEQLGTATRSLVANIAPVSPAVASPPTRRLVLNSRSQSSESSGAFSATVTSVRGNELQIQLPDGSTASGWIPFSKTGFGTPQIKVEPPSAGGGSRVSAGSLASSDEVGTSARKPKGSVPGRLPSEGGATGAGGQTQASGGRGGASSGGGGGSSSVTRSPSSGGGGDLNFSTQKQQEISRLKLQLVRAQDPLQAIKSHIEDLRRNSMMVIYNGQQYPPDLQNPETTIDLNRYRGNR